MAAIGIIGGVGPEAGLDLAHKVFAQTKAQKDQEHIDLFLTSIPREIPDRTEFLLKDGESPVAGLQKSIDILAAAGATAAAIACNTAHSPQILDALKFPPQLKFVNMIDATCRHLAQNFSAKKIGLLATLGTIETKVYDFYIQKHPDLTLIKCENETRQKVQDAIYNKSYGIKAASGKTEKNFAIICAALDELAEKGCSAAILGCTELPLLFGASEKHKEISLVDPTKIVARELIRAVDESKLS